jgi:hypothetical protein
MNVQDAVDTPRFHHQWLPDRLWLEPAISPDTVALLKSHGYDVGYSSGPVLAQVAAIVSDAGWLQAPRMAAALWVKLPGIDIVRNLLPGKRLPSAQPLDTIPIRTDPAFRRRAFRPFPPWRRESLEEVGWALFLSKAHCGPLILRRLISSSIRHAMKVRLRVV